MSLAVYNRGPAWGGENLTPWESWRDEEPLEMFKVCLLLRKKNEYTIPFKLIASHRSTTLMLTGFSSNRKEAKIQVDPVKNSLLGRSWMFPWKLNNQDCSLTITLIWSTINLYGFFTYHLSGKLSSYLWHLCTHASAHKGCWLWVLYLFLFTHTPFLSAAYTSPCLWSSHQIKNALPSTSSSDLC